MRFKRYDRRYNKMLWIGLAIWIVSWLGNVLLSVCGVEVAPQDTLMDMGKEMFQQSPIFCLLLLCLLAPILEECSFRLWGRGKTWCVIVSMILMLFFTIGELGWWTIFVIGGMTAVCFLVKNKYLRNWIVAIGSSLMFMLCHISGFSGFSIGAALGLLDTFGFAMVSAYLTINLSFWFSILLHVLNNSLAIILPLMFVGESFLIEGNNYSLEAQPIKAFAKSRCCPEVNKIQVGDTIMLSYCGELPEIACKLYMEGIQHHPDTLYTWKSSNESLESRYNISLSCGTTFHNFRESALALMKSAELIFDTNEVDACSIWITDAENTSMLLSDKENHESIFNELLSRGDRGRSRYWSGTDSNGVTTYWYVYKPTEITEMLAPTYETLYEYKVDYVPDHKIVEITIKEK